MKPPLFSSGPPGHVEGTNILSEAKQELAATLPLRLIEHIGDLWPAGEPAATPKWIRANIDDILAALEQMLRHDRRDVRSASASIALAGVAA
jgi:hypothetical protein